MGVEKKDLYRLVDRLNEIETHTAYDFMNYLLLSRAKRSWQAIAEREPDTVPLSKEELDQLQSKEGYLSWEDAKRELGL